MSSSSTQNRMRMDSPLPSLVVVAAEEDALRRRTSRETPLLLAMTNSVNGDTHNYYSSHRRRRRRCRRQCCCAAPTTTNTESSISSSTAVREASTRQSAADWQRFPLVSRVKAAPSEGLGHCCRDSSEDVAQKLNEILLSAGCPDNNKTAAEEVLKRGGEHAEKLYYCDNGEQVNALVDCAKRGTKKGYLDCDCESCLDEELLHVEREILLMISKQQQQPPREEALSAAAEPVDGGGGGAAAAGVGDKQWRYVYVRKVHKGTGGRYNQQAIETAAGVFQEEEEDEEFYDETRHDQELDSLAAMVTGGGGGIGLGYSEMATVPTEKNASTATGTVEGQLSALLKSGSKEVVSTGTTLDVKGARRHTNLIENQLLTLEDQFWKSGRNGAGNKEPEVTCTAPGLGSAIQSAVLEATEDTALLADQSQQMAMSDSTPVKRVMKVVAVGSGGSAVVLEEDPGGGVPRMVASPSTNLSRMKRFEQFLKSLVGKKSSPGALHHDVLSKDMGQQDAGAGTAAEVPGKMFEHPAIRVRSSGELKSRMLAGGEDRDPEDMPTLRRPSFGSMSSLNSAVQQKFLNILPSSASALSLSATKRNLSVNNLSTIPERKCASGADAGLSARRAMVSSCCRNGVPMRKAVRGLKTVSCSFSNFEHLSDVSTDPHQIDVTRGGRRTGDQLRNGEADERDGNAVEEDRRDSLHSWRLKVSKSTNHLQSMMMLAANGAGGGPVRPLNRFRNSLLESSVSQVNLVAEAQCSRCSSILSLAGGKVRCSDSSVTGESSEESLPPATTTAVDGGGCDAVAGQQDVIVVTREEPESTVQSCKLCLGEVSPQQLTGISQCRCSFCTDCMRAYIEFEILEGAYEISCPDAMCPAQGVVTMTEIAALTSPDLVMKHNRYRLNREVELDKNRTWCPRAGCDTVCLVDGINQPSSSAASAMINVISPSTTAGGAGKNAAMVAYAVRCPTCEEEFCSACKKTWHPRLSCEENMKKLAADGHTDSVGIPFDTDLIKCCPMCGVPIEKDEGCAQMMCKRCKHVFCWYCLASLDDDFLLRHYDKGPCKNKLGHSRASVVWHRAQVIGIFAGFGILLLVASPLLLLAAPCIVCCKCRICSGPKSEEEHDNDIDFDDPLTLHRIHVLIS